MAKGVELGVGYISVIPETSKFAAGIEKAAKDSAQKVAAPFKQAGRTSAQGFGKSFGGELSQSMPLSGFRSSLRQYEGVAAKSGAAAGKALGVAFKTAATAGIAGLGYTLFKGFERYQALDAATNKLHNMNRTFAQLGKTGFDVQDTLDGVRGVLEKTPFALEQGFSLATNAIASGMKDVTKYVEDISNAAAYAQSDLQTMGAIFNQVMVKGKLQGDELLQFFNAGLPIDTWLKDVYGAQGDISEMISEGRIGIEQLQYVVQKFAQGSAASMQDTLQGSVMQAQTAFARLGETILSSLFGSATESGTTDLQRAINGITQHINKLTKWVKDHREDIKEFFDGAVDAAQKLINGIERVLGWLDKINVGVGDVVLAFVAWKSIAGIAALSKALSGIESMLGTQLPVAADKGAKGITAALNKVAVPAWLMYLVGQQNPFHNPEIPGSPAEAAKAALDSGTLNTDERGNILPPADVAPGPQYPSAMTPGLRDFLVPGSGSLTVPAPRETLHNSQGLMPATGDGGIGEPPPLQDASGDGEDGKRPPRPVVPFNTELPQWARGGPVTPETFSAESSWLDARHDLAEKRAYVTQLEQSGVATEQELLDARNAVFQADRDMQEQDMRLQETKRKAYESFYKTGKETTDQFSELASAVQLDEDLGISRGLVGLADNLFKFLAGLAAAPLKGLLAGIENRLKPYTVEAQMEAMGGRSGGGGAGFGGMFGSLQNSLFGSMFGGGGSSGMFPGQLTPEMVDQIATQQFGLTRGSTLRDEPGSYHHTGQATDYNGPAGQMAAFAHFMSANFGTELSELIHDAPGFAGNVNDGKNVGAFGGFFNEAQAGRHDDHVHIATQNPRGSAPSLPFSGGGGGQGALMNLMMAGQRQSSGDPRAAVYQAMLQAGFPPSEWAALEQLITNESGFRPDARNPSSGAFGMFQFLGHENDKYGALGGYSPDPAMQSRAGMQYIKDRYGSPSQAWQFWQQNQANGNAWYATGGDVPGTGNRDTVPAMLTPGEHVLTTKDVAALGGHSGVYSFRNALHRNGGGPGFPLTPQEELDLAPVDDAPTAPEPTAPAPTPADVAGPTITAPPAPAPFGGGTQVERPEPGPVSPDLAPQLAPSAPPMLGPDGAPVKGPDGRPLGMDGKPIQAPSNPQDEALARLAGFIPKAAKANTVAGTSNLSRIWMSGAEVINGLIDQGASAASTAVSAAITGASFGAGAAGAAQAGSAGAQFAIGLGTEAAKRGVSYWAQMGGIASDAIVEQMFPFGAPSFIGFDSAQNSINGLIEQDKKAKRPGGVYDSGGILEPGGVAVNMSKRPESVLTQQQWDLMKQTAPAAPAHGINIENISVSDVDELSRSLNARQRLAAMQYTGRPGM